MSLFHVSCNFKRKIFEKKIGMTKIDRHFLLPNVVICFTLYTREIARNHLSYFVACKCVIYFRVTYLVWSCTKGVEATVISVFERKIFFSETSGLKRHQLFIYDVINSSPKRLNLINPKNFIFSNLTPFAVN